MWRSSQPTTTAVDHQHGHGEPPARLVHLDGCLQRGRVRLRRDPVGEHERVVDVGLHDRGVAADRGRGDALPVRIGHGRQQCHAGEHGGSRQDHPVDHVGMIGHIRGADERAEAVSEQEDRPPRRREAGTQHDAGRVLQPVGQSADLAGKAGAAAVAPEVGGEHRVARLGQAGADVLVAAGMLGQAVHERDCGAGTARLPFPGERRGHGAGSFHGGPAPATRPHGCSRAWRDV